MGADVNTTAKHETALSVALARANIDVVLELLQCGVKHDRMKREEREGERGRGEGREGRRGERGKTALSVALARANIDVVLELLQCGVKHDRMREGGERERGEERREGGRKRQREYLYSIGS